MVIGFGRDAILPAVVKTETHFNYNVYVEATRIGPREYSFRVSRVPLLGGGEVTAKNFHQYALPGLRLPYSLFMEKRLDTDALTAEELRDDIRKRLEAELEEEVAPIHLTIDEKDYGFFS